MNARLCLSSDKARAGRYATPYNKNERPFFFYH